MNEPALYSQVNDLQRSITKQFLSDYGNLLRWRKDGLDALIDIGSGTGDVLMDYVYPLLPKNYEILVFSDLSENMVNHAKKHYEMIERTDFKVLDIATDVVPQQLCARFDHVTSFFSLHWVQQQRKALENIYSMLRPATGDCLHLIVVSFLNFQCFELLAEDVRWSKYMQGYKSLMPPLYHYDDPAAEFRKRLKEIGFVNCQVENLKFDYVFHSRLQLFNFLKSIGIFFERMPVEEHEDYFEDIVSIAKSRQLCEFIENGEDYKVIVPLKYIMAYARRQEV